MTWNDLLSKSAFDSNLMKEVESVLREEAEHHLKWNKRRLTGAAVRSGMDALRDRFAAVVESHLRLTNAAPLTGDDILGRPRFWLVAWAVSERLQGRR